MPSDVSGIDFYRRMMVQFGETLVTSDARLLAYRELEGMSRALLKIGWQASLIEQARRPWCAVQNRLRWGACPDGRARPPEGWATACGP